MLLGLWGLVNNAGIFYLGNIELIHPKITQRVLDVNLHGMMNVTRTFLPLVRHSRGRIVNMSSLSGEIFVKNQYEVGHL